MPTGRVFLDAWQASDNKLMIFPPKLGSSLLFPGSGNCVSYQIRYLGHSMSITNTPLSHSQLICKSWPCCFLFSPLRPLLTALKSPSYLIPSSLSGITAESPIYPHVDLALSFTIHLTSHQLISPTSLPLAILSFFSLTGFPELYLVSLFI